MIGDTEPKDRRPYWRAVLWLRRHRIRGRDWFVWRICVLRFALPASLVATLLRAMTEPFRLGHFGLHLIANGCAGVIGGYIAGRVLWELIVDR